MNKHTHLYGPFFSITILKLSRVKTKFQKIEIMTSFCGLTIIIILVL